MTRLAILLCGALLAQAVAADDGKNNGILVELSAEASQPAPNDLGRLVAYAETTAATPGEAAAKINGLIGQALALAKASPTIRTNTGSTWTYPVYGKSSRTIEGWRMRSELRMESRDVPALSVLAGKLQVSLAVGQISMQPGDDTLRGAESQATREALQFFRSRAAEVADNFKRSYRIVHLNVSGAGSRPPIYAMAQRGVAMAEAAPMPMEPGESAVTVTVSGQIELLER